MKPSTVEPSTASPLPERVDSGVIERNDLAVHQVQQGAAPNTELFSPSRVLHNGHLQTVLALAEPKLNDAYHVDQPIVVDAGPDLCDSAVTARTSRRVRLVAYFTPHRSPREQVAMDGTATMPLRTVPARDERQGLVVTLHGWLGCSHSNYNRITTAALTNHGYDVLRLNLRDHGPGYHLQSHAMNPGIFLGILIEEAHYAVQQLALLAGDRPFYIVGVSMGGNFALRMALRHLAHPIPNLRKVIAINPAINPASATDNVDRYPFYRRFFRRRWLDSLLAKEAIFPELYDFRELHNYPTIRSMTEHLIGRYGERFGDFRTADQYFAQYAVAPAALSEVSVPTTIITAKDDPIIDVNEFHSLQPHRRLAFQLHPTGGHVGYVSLFPLAHFLPKALLHALSTP